MDNFLNLINDFSIIDYIFLFFIIFFAFLCLKKGFVLSLLSFLKWIIAYILVKVFLPIITPYTANIIKSEFANSHLVIFSTFFLLLSMDSYLFGRFSSKKFCPSTIKFMNFPLLKLLLHLSVG